jgi:hypothetical protein
LATDEARAGRRNRASQSGPAAEPWTEQLKAEGDLRLARYSNPNDELIALGERASHSRWPLDNP